MQLSRRSALVATITALLLGTACSDSNDPTSPTVAQVAGSYRATTFTATTALGAQDVLQSGGSLTARFDPAGTVTGHVTIPSETVDEDFAGTWKITNGQVEIDGVPTDIFVEDLSFKVVGSTLVADDTFSGVRVQVVLTKQ
jgi:hypothetical protein